MATRHRVLTVIAAACTSFALLGCGGEAGTSATPATQEAGASATTEPKAKKSKKPRESKSPTPTRVKTGCEAAAETLEVTYGEPVAYSDLVAKDADRTWRHEFPVTVKNPSDETCFFRVRGQFEIEGEWVGKLDRWIALRPQQTARLGDVPVMEELVPFEPADAKDAKPSKKLEARIRSIEGQAFTPDFYDYDVVSIEPRQRGDVEYEAGIWAMHGSYVLDATVKLNAVDPAGKYPDVEEQLKKPGVMTTIYINGLDADGVVVATWSRVQVVRDDFIFEMQSVGGGETEPGLTARGDVFFQSLEASESVVDYDVLTLQPMDLLDY